MDERLSPQFATGRVSRNLLQAPTPYDVNFPAKDVQGQGFGHLLTGWIRIGDNRKTFHRNHLKIISAALSGGLAPLSPHCIFSFTVDNC
jgi:hypothetical protein